MWSVGIGLDVGSREQVFAAIQLLEDRGQQPGRPVVDGVTHSRHVIALDPKRQAVKFIAGDKAENWDHW